MPFERPKFTLHVSEKDAPPSHLGEEILRAREAAAAVKGVEESSAPQPTVEKAPVNPHERSNTIAAINFLRGEAHATDAHSHEVFANLDALIRGVADGHYDGKTDMALAEAHRYLGSRPAQNEGAHQAL